MRAEGFIYIAHSDASGLFKVGISVTPERRITALQTADPSIKLLGSWATSDMPLIERLVHRRLSPCHISREWFHLSPAMLSWLRDLLEGKPVGSPPLHLN